MMAIPEKSFSPQAYGAGGNRGHPVACRLSDLPFWFRQRLRRRPKLACGLLEQISYYYVPLSFRAERLFVDGKGADAPAGSTGNLRYAKPEHRRAMKVVPWETLPAWQQPLFDFTARPG
jgi:hypothetical protein